MKQASDFTQNKGHTHADHKTGNGKEPSDPLRG